MTLVLFALSIRRGARRTSRVTSEVGGLTRMARYLSGLTPVSFSNAIRILSSLCFRGKRMGDLLEDRLREADRRAVQQPITETIFPSKPYEEVNHPEHYGGNTPYEVIKVMRAWLTHEEFVGALKFNIHKYTMRLGKKPGVRDQKDAEKVAWYSDYLATYLAERTNAEKKRGNTDSGS